MKKIIFILFIIILSSCNKDVNPGKGPPPCTSEIHKKITNQQFNNDFIIEKIKEIQRFHSSALHWNLNELNTNLHNVIDKVKTAYPKMVL